MPFTYSISAYPDCKRGFSFFRYAFNNVTHYGEHEKHEISACSQTQVWEHYKFSLSFVDGLRLPGTENRYFQEQKL